MRYYAVDMMVPSSHSGSPRFESATTYHARQLSAQALFRTRMIIASTLFLALAAPAIIIPVGQRRRFLEQVYPCKGGNNNINTAENLQLR
jgi:hypothetical protein